MPTVAGIVNWIFTDSKVFISTIFETKLTFDHWFVNDEQHGDGGRRNRPNPG